MKFNQLERAVVVMSAAVFLLATADGIGMTWVCPASGPGRCSEPTSTNALTTSATGANSTPRQSSGDFAGSLGPCLGDKRSFDEPAPLAPASQQGIPCPISASSGSQQSPLIR